MMKQQRRQMLVLLFFFAAVVAVNSHAAFAASEQKPNVLFLFTDDQRADTIAALGNSSIQTPNLDELVHRGFTFRRAYCMGSNVGAVCRPSRNMLLSGRAFFRFGRNAEADNPNFPTSMKQAGYKTYHHGKRGNVADEIHKEFDHNKYLQDREARTSGEPGQEIVDSAITFLKERSTEKPFFLYLAFSTPHDPRVAAEKYMKRYKREEIPLPANYMPLHPFDNGEMTIRDEKLAPWPRTKDEVRKHLHDYYAVITGLDGHIGRLLQHLKESGDYDNTIIIFSSDHGLAIGSHGLMGKQSLYEHSMKSPLIFSGPGIPRGESEALVYLFDIYPTVCELVGAPVPEGLDGISLVPILRGEQESVRQGIFTAYKDVMRGMNDGHWKLIRYPHINKTQLFHLDNDPDELNDLSADPEEKPTIERLMSALKNTQRTYGDSAPLTSENPQDSTFTPPSEKSGTN